MKYKNMLIFYRQKIMQIMINYPYDKRERV